MIMNISWATYYCTVAIVLLLWYLYVGFRYFRTDISRAAGWTAGTPLHWDAGPGEGQPEVAEPAPNLAAKGTFEENSFNDFEIIEELVDRVKALITESVEHKAPKDNFLTTLHHILKDYPTLRHSQFRPSVNEFITTECDAQGMEPVSTEEVEQAWRA